MTMAGSNDVDRVGICVHRLRDDDLAAGVFEDRAEGLVLAQ